MATEDRKSPLKAGLLGGLIALMLPLALTVTTKPAAAQQVIGFQPGVGPICTGPLGVAPCAVIQQWMARQSMPSMGVPVPPMGGGMPGGMGGLPGAGLLPEDGQIVANIAQDCGGEPRCMAIAWGSVEVQRCRNGIGVEGGCFGPNGEIMKVINRFVPQNFQPNVIARNVGNDLQNGPGRNNDLVGCNGFVPRMFGSRC